MNNNNLAGLYFLASGAITFLGFSMRESLESVYSIRNNTISDLGAFNASHSALLSVLFSAIVITSGLCILVGAYHSKQMHGKLLTNILYLYGLGSLLVGVFPSNLGWPHFVSALVSFIFGAVSALVTAKTTTKYMRVISLILGLVSVGAMLSYLGLQNIVGVGGAERLVVYPITTWLMIYGGYLLAQLQEKTSEVTV